MRLYKYTSIFNRCINLVQELKDNEKIKLLGKGEDSFCPQVIQPEKYELKDPSIDPKTKKQVALPAKKIKQTPLELLKLKKVAQL